MRVQPDWSDIEAAWFEAEERLGEGSGIRRRRDPCDARAGRPADVLDRDAIAAEAGELIEAGEKLRRNISRIIGEDSRETICWLTITRRDASPSLVERAAVRRRDAEDAAVRAEGERRPDERDAEHGRNFDYIKQRLGVEDRRKS